MTVDQQAATASIRAKYYDSAIKQIAKRLYKFKQAVSIVSTGAWKNYFYREESTVLTGQSGNAIKGIPRGAAFPQAVVQWEQVLSTIEKYGLEDNIPYEDLISNDIDMRDRTLYKIAEGVAKSVDDAIWDTLTESRTATNIQSVAITAGYSWDQTSAAVIDNLLQAKQKIAEYNYPTENLMCFVSPQGYRDIMNYLASKGAQFPQIGNNVASNGVQGTICGIDLIVSNSVTASYALVVVPQICGTWRELVPLSTETKEDPFRSTMIRAIEMGVTQLTDPKAVVLISNTDAP